MSADGTEREEVTVQGPPQEPVRIEDGDGYSKVIKRVVLRSDTQQSEVRPGAEADGHARWGVWACDRHMARTCGAESNWCVTWTCGVEGDVDYDVGVWLGM